MAKWWVKRQAPDLSPRRGAANSSAPNQFMRSRTISAYTPTASPDLARSSVNELRRHRQRLAKLLVFSVAVVSILAVFLSQLTAGVGSISYQPATTSSPDAQSISRAVNDYYATRPLERLRFLLDTKTLGQFIASKVPEVGGVQSVGADGLGTLQLALTMRIPVASWQVGGQTVYVDKDGTSFTHNYYGAPAVTVSDNGLSGVGSTELASSSMISYIGQLIAALQANGTGTVQRIVLPAGKIRELDVYLQGRAYYVKVQLDRDVNSQAADVKAALTYIDAHGGAGEYVDARVQGKAFYR